MNGLVWKQQHHRRKMNACFLFLVCKYLSPRQSPLLIGKQKLKHTPNNIAHISLNVARLCDLQMAIQPDGLSVPPLLPEVCRKRGREIPCWMIWMEDGGSVLLSNFHLSCFQKDWHCGWLQTKGGVTRKWSLMSSYRLNFFNTRDFIQRAGGVAQLPQQGAASSWSLGLKVSSKCILIQMCC